MSNVPRIFSHTHKAFIIADHKSLFLSKFVSPNRLKTRQSLLNLKLSLRKTGPLVNFVPSWNVYFLFAKNIVQF